MLSSKTTQNKTIYMKKYICMLAAAVLGLASCSEDYLETAPEDSTATSTILGSTDNAKMAINGICRLMTHQYLGSQGFNGEGTIKTWYGNYPGNDFQKSNLTGWASIINGTYHLRTDSSYDYYPWYYYYMIIGNANGVICNIDAATGAQEDKDFYKAQALVFRAYAYSQLVQLYCVRWADSNNGSADGLVLRLDQSTGAISRSSMSKTYQQIYADLDEAISLFNTCGLDRGKDEFYKPNINVAYAVKARTALCREDWATAASCAQAARKDYSIMSNAEYLSGGYTPNDEWIWGVYEASDQTLYYYSYYAYQGSNSSASICRSYPCAISKELIDQIPETDVRRSLFGIPTAEEMAELDKNGKECISQSNGASTTGAFFKRMKADHAADLYSTSLIFAYMQFKQRCEFTPGGGSFSLFRAAEMCYIEAEADCHLNKEGDAQQLLFKLTSPRDAAYTMSKKTGADLLAEVKLYRRFDLWGEGFDWFDYKRWNEPIVRKSYKDGGSFHSTFAVTVKPEDGNQWTWALPDREKNYNELVTLVED